MKTIRAQVLGAVMLVLIPAVSRGEMSITASGASICAGDCDMDGTVTVGELIVGVNIALSRALRDACPALDTNNDNRVAVNEIVTAVSSLLCNCRPCPTPRPTSTATRTATTTPTRPPSTPTPTTPRSADRAIAPCDDDCQVALNVCGEDRFFEEYGSVGECTDECVSIVEDYALEAVDFDRCVDTQVTFIECCTRARQCGQIPDGCDSEFENAVFGCGDSFGGCPLIFFGEGD